MEYITTAQAAAKWGITANRVFKLIKADRIPGAVKLGNSWMIPENAEKPSDRRMSTNKPEKVEYQFRYPAYEYRNPASFNPPLSEAELTLKETTELFYACRFEEAEERLGNLPNTAEDRYLRITALYTACMIDIFVCNVNDFYLSYSKLSKEFAEDFPYKREMKEFLYEIDASLGNDEYYENDFQVDPLYTYHESFLPRLTALTTTANAFAGAEPTLDALRAQEMNCKLFEKLDDYYVDLQAIHANLGIAYARVAKEKESRYHLREAALIAEKYDMLYMLTWHYHNLVYMFDSVFEELPPSFREHIKAASISVNTRFRDFMKQCTKSNIYTLIHGDEYNYILYAVQGLSNKEIAKRMSVSVSTVNRRYSDLYTALGVDSKQGLVEMYNRLSGTVLNVK